MDVSKIRVARAELEAEVLSLFEDFRRRTGLCVVGCEIHIIETVRMEDKCPQFLLDGVAIKTEQI